MDLLIRKKRVIDETRSGDMSSSLGRFPYIVNILKNGISHCAGIIMEPDIILTVNTCIMPPISERFSILSGSSERDNGTTHSIIRNRVFSSRSSSGNSYNNVFDTPVKKYISNKKSQSSQMTFCNWREPIYCNRANYINFYVQWCLKLIHRFNFVNLMVITELNCLRNCYHRSHMLGLVAGDALKEDLGKFLYIFMQML